MENQPLLLRSYQALVVDEAHKLPDAARQMYTEKLAEADMNGLCLQLQQAHYLHLEQRLRSTFLAFSISCGQNLSRLRRKDSVSVYAYAVSPRSVGRLHRHFAVCRRDSGDAALSAAQAGRSRKFLPSFFAGGSNTHPLHRLRCRWQPTFCAASSRVPQLLRSALWNTREPAILTSGTLAAAGDFSHTEQLLGLTTYRPLRHFRADSPFNYKEKCLLYLPPRIMARV